MYNGWTPSIPLKTRLENLAAQIPQEKRADALAQCVQGNPYDFERFLAAYVMTRPEDTDIHAVDFAQEVEREIDEILDGRTPAENIKEFFGAVKITTSAEWRKRHL